jgi:hypothetical protein
LKKLGPGENYLIEVEESTNDVFQQQKLFFPKNGDDDVAVLVKKLGSPLAGHFKDIKQGTLAEGEGSVPLTSVY